MFECNTYEEVMRRARTTMRRVQAQRVVPKPKCAEVQIVPIKHEPTVEEIVVAYAAVINRATETADKVRHIKGTIRDYFDLTEEELTNDRRTVRYVFPRHIAIFLISKYTKLSLPAIGRHFRNRDHTSILHAICMMRERQYTDPEIGAAVSYFDELIGERINVVD